ncbi:DNA-helicase RecQ [Sesbania bispinosa]|nr:DNA-helicase RecQ [Sesbania bispinosa]
MSGIAPQCFFNLHLFELLRGVEQLRPLLPPSATTRKQRSVTEKKGVSGDPSSICSLYSLLTTRLKPTARDGGPMLHQSTSTAVMSIATEQPADLQPLLSHGDGGPVLQQSTSMGF